MNNLIDREQAIAALGTITMYKGMIPFDTATERIKRMPSAQLDTNLAEVGTDCISRQAAIDACGGYLVPVNIIKQLPSAQPEHIRGHWICDRSWSEGVGMGESYGHYWKCDKCGNLEQGDWGECGCNFCPNCGADMRTEAHDD